jgi:hypothetical protein
VTTRGAPTDLLTVVETARILRCTRRSVHNLLSRGLLEPVHPTGLRKTLITRSSLERVLGRRRERPRHREDSDE